MNQDFFYFLASYLIVFFGGFFFINWLSNGFLTRFLKVKASRGSKIMVIVNSKIRNYPVIGKLDDGMLVFHTPQSRAFDKKAPLRIPITDSKVFYRMFGVVFANYHEDSGNLLMPDLKGLKSWDPQRWSIALLRALSKPADQPNKQILLIILFIICLITMFACAALYFKLNQIQVSINALQSVAQVAGANV